MWRRQDVQHARAHRNLDQRLTAAGQSLVIAAETTPTDNPGEGSLDHPSSGLRTKAGGEEFFPINLLAFGDEQPPLRNSERLDGLDGREGPSQRDLGPCTEGAAIVAISPYQLETGKEFLQRLEQGTASLLIGALGSSHLDRQQVACRI